MSRQYVNYDYNGRRRWGILSKSYITIKTARFAQWNPGSLFFSIIILLPVTLLYQARQVGNKSPGFAGKGLTYKIHHCLTLAPSLGCPNSAPRDGQTDRAFRGGQFWRQTLGFGLSKQLQGALSLGSQAPQKFKKWLYKSWGWTTIGQLTQ